MAFRFDRFSLHPDERQLRRDGVPVELNARYFDALVLLVREQGRLVSKDRFMDVVWRGVPVTDEALTQCIRTLRRVLDDAAVGSRFIETVPKHGYRFIAPVDGGEAAGAARPASAGAWRNFFLTGAGGTIGGALAGLLGGLIYGFAGASAPESGALSVLLVLVSLCLLVATIGAAGVAFGIAAAGFAPRRHWLWDMSGGAFGGLAVGAAVKLLGLDAFDLLFGRSPGDITGAFEGMLLGGAVGLGAWWARGLSLRRGMAAGALTTGAAGLLVTLTGGRMMAGSLDLLARQFPESRLRLDGFGALFGEAGLGRVAQIATGGLEGALFGAGIVGAMIVAARRFAPGQVEVTPSQTMT